MFACLHVSDFPVQAVLLSETKDEREALEQSPVVVLDGPANLLKVVSLNDPARRAGIEAGMTRLQVETCGGVLLKERSVKREEAAQAELLQIANSFSPRVESTAAGTAILDLTGTEKLFGSAASTAQKISEDARERGFHLRVGIASNPDTALYAARGFPGIKIIPPGDEAEHLAHLSVDILPISPERVETLDSWGIRSFQAFAALPEIPLVERLGQEGLYLQRLARGQVKRTLVPVEESPDFIESYEFDDPVETLESLSFILDRLLQQLCARLAARSLSTNKLLLTLNLKVCQRLRGKNAERYEHEWKLPIPTQDKNVLLTLVRVDLERQTFSAPIGKVILQAFPVKPRNVQCNLFAPPSPEAEQLAITLLRIRGIVCDHDVEDASCVGSPELKDTHKPDSFYVRSFSNSTDATSVRIPTPTVPIEIFRPALETSVERSGDVPCFVRFGRGYRRVLAASGPWCNSGNWWNDAWDRQEWDLALKTTTGVGMYRIYLDCIQGRWFVEGMFD